MNKLIIAAIFLFAECVFAEEPINLLPADGIKVNSSVRDVNSYPKHAPILLVSCVDYRFPDEIADFMQKRGAVDKYDHLVVAGGSIGVDNLLYPALKESFIIQMALLKQLHGFRQVILLDHRDCGLFKAIHGNEHTSNPAEELALHKHHLVNVKKLILKHYPDVAVEMLLMSTDGSVTTIE
jgi:hypothetical protein